MARPPLSACTRCSPLPPKYHTAWRSYAVMLVICSLLAIGGFGIGALWGTPKAEGRHSIADVGEKGQRAGDAETLQALHDALEQGKVVEVNGYLIVPTGVQQTYVYQKAFFTRTECARCHSKGIWGK